ncbi:MAG: ParB N-terminal domain-containing protein [Bacteroidota bacterium]
MKRRIETYGKGGVLEISGNPQETILYLKGKPIQYSWYAEIGSIWRYHIAQGLNKKAVQLNKRVEGQLRQGIANEGEFLGIAQYFNSFFSYGTYEYGYYELLEDLQWINIPETEEYRSFDYYGGAIDISPTQNAINEELVAEYKEEILAGLRPPVVLLHVENSWMFHLLDGHHKFCAYQVAKIKPHAIIITKLGNEYKTTEETIALAQSMNCSRQDYLEHMKREKRNLQRYRNKKLVLEEAFRLIKGG